ncbi:MAG TPA: SulP family inorganic anion transporter [Casimicrobiaceae bacterium]|nr:SulP family inorganic anion transporter [Casimicrobiaceae bacterium]
MPLTLFGGIRSPGGRGALRDALAGVTLASMSIPQVLGYTRIAGTPIVSGLYTLLLPLVAFAVFGSSRHLVVAADSATAAILASGLSDLAAPGSERYMALVATLALLTAALLLIARAFKLGFLADFLSRTVLAGFLAGVGIQVGVAVLGEMLGVALTTHSTVDQLREVLSRLSEINRPTVSLSALVVAAVLVSRRVLPHLPVPLVAVVAGIVASKAYDFAGRGIAVIGPVAGGLPSLSVPLPTWHELRELLPVAASCFAIIIAQSAAAARIFAQRHHERLDENADILGLAAANAAAGVSGAFVVNGSLTQTAMGERAGARSQIAQLAAAAVVVAILLFATTPLQYLPRCVLAAIVFTIAVGLVDIASLRDILAESPGEFALAMVTAAAVVIFGLEQGILLAVSLSLLRHVRHSYLPHTMVLAPDAMGRWVPVPATPGVQTEPGLIVYRFGADLFYANEDRFADEVRSLVKRAPTPVRWLVVDAGAVIALDYSAARMLRDLDQELSQFGVELVFARVSPYLRSDMERHRIAAALGDARIFATLHEAVEAVRGPSKNGIHGPDV